MLKKISKKLGFTETEVLVILFLAGIFILGFIYKEFFKEERKSEYKNFNYSKEDSLFSYYSKLNPESDPDDSLLISNVETKRKVLELADTSSYAKKDISTLQEKSININSASVKDFMKLPGIGEKTAEKIIELRKERGKFNKLEDIMDVKGIGEVKFNKIKKFLYIE
jgi:competence ComEA-like helix-hairpin-helix protein